MNTSPSLLIIDDEIIFRQLLARIIGLEGFTIFQAESVGQGLKILEKQKNIDLILTDVKLPDGNGIAFIEKLRAASPGSEVIVMTAFGTIHDGVEAMKRGAFDYFTKGNDNEQIILALNRAADKVRLQKRVTELENRLGSKYGFETILGSSKIILDTIRMAEKVAPTDSTVLLEGETGVGKELFAQALHHASPRKSKPFVAVNCSAFSKELMESELFGHRKGAFTGAVADKKGLFEEANEGTLFLDEIGEMNPDLQAKLLRVLETQTFLKVGEAKETHVNVRFIAATNRNLKNEVEHGHFREDLYYRLSSFKLSVPCLRERKEDIETLAEHFMKLYASKIQKKIRGMESDFLKKLKDYQWKGNIRELKNAMERAVILSDRETLSVDLLPPEILIPDSCSGEKSTMSIAAIEKWHIENVLNHTNGNKAEAARILEIGLATLYRKIEDYGLHKRPVE